MAVALTDNGQELLEMLPRCLQNSVDYRNIIHVFSEEIDFLDESYLDIVDQIQIQTATWGLKYWEQVLSLPVEQDGATYAERRISILSKLAANNVVSAADFRNALEIITETLDIRFDIDTSTVFITMTYDPAEEYSVQRLEELVSLMMPAHLNYNVQFDAFIAGVSMAGDSL